MISYAKLTSRADRGAPLLIGDGARRSRPQRIVGFAFNGENVSEQSRFVDHMIVAESTFSQRGRPKELMWNLSAPPPEHVRVTHVVERANHYTPGAKWGQESQVRRILGRGLQDLYIQGRIFDEDLMAIVDADERLDERAWVLLQAKESQRPGRVWRVSLHWALYNPCWIHPRYTTVAAMATVETLRRMAWRAASDALPLSEREAVGIHCSWCFGETGSVEARAGFRRKLVSMTDGDATDYNAYEREAWDDARIDSMMRRGLWLDGMPHGRNVCTGRGSAVT